MAATNLETMDAEAAAVAVAPRVTLSSMEAKIAGDFYIQPYGTTLTLCILRMQNGFNVVGESACASSENFNAEFGRKLAYEDAIRQLWRLEGYALRETLAQWAQQE